MRTAAAAPSQVAARLSGLYRPRLVMLSWSDSGRGGRRTCRHAGIRGHAALPRRAPPGGDRPCPDPPRRPAGLYPPDPNSVDEGSVAAVLVVKDVTTDLPLNDGVPRRDGVVPNRVEAQGALRRPAGEQPAVPEGQDSAVQGASFDDQLQSHIDSAVATGIRLNGWRMPDRPIPPQCSRSRGGRQKLSMIRPGQHRTGAGQIRPAVGV